MTRQSCASCVAVLGVRRREGSKLREGIVRFFEQPAAASVRSGLAGDPPDVFAQLGDPLCCPSRSRSLRVSVRGSQVMPVFERASAFDAGHRPAHADHEVPYRCQLEFPAIRCALLLSIARIRGRTGPSRPDRMPRRPESVARCGRGSLGVMQAIPTRRRELMDYILTEV